MAPVDRYHEWAVEAVRGILEQEHAVIWSEVEARASEHPWGGLPRPVDPHHLTTARRLLTQSGEMASSVEQTKGGRFIEVHFLVGDGKRAVADAAARKRLLQARFLGWAKGTRRHPRGLIGGAGESVTAASLEAAAGSGYQLVDRERGDVKKVFGQPVVGGPLDNAAHLITMQDDIPAGVVTVPIEVKNIRECLYPTAVEIYQLLYKAARMQNDYPDRSFVPVLVCRRAHKTLFRMARSFGFYVMDSRRQFITPSADVTDEHLLEIRRELAYADLIKHAGADDLLTNHFRTYLPRVAAGFAERWAATAPVMEPVFKSFRIPGDPVDRARAMVEFRNHAKAQMGDRGGW